MSQIVQKLHGTNTNNVTVYVTKLENCKDLNLPQYATSDSAGLDLLAAIEAPLTLKPMQRALIPTGIAIALPEGYEAQIRPRSGLALKHGISIVNAPGTIDADYRGPIGVILINLGESEFTINRGDRIAQMVIVPYTRLSWAEIETLEVTKRGAGGFGHTGI